MRSVLSFTSGLLLGLLIISLTGCEKKDKDRYYGIDVIDNTLYGTQFYYAYGFSFEAGEKLSTIESPAPDITIHASTDLDGNIIGMYINSPNLIESFSLAGSFNTAKEAEDYFNDLLDVGSPQWTLNAPDVEENQVWLFRTSEDNYVKFRIIELITDDNVNPPKVEMRFEWRLQPGGSSIFTS